MAWGKLSRWMDFYLITGLEYPEKIPDELSEIVQHQ